MVPSRRALTPLMFQVAIFMAWVVAAPTTQRKANWSRTAAVALPAVGATRFRPSRALGSARGAHLNQKVIACRQLLAIAPRFRICDQALDLHLRKLPADAPIREVISAPEVTELLGSFRDADTTALKEQKSYRRYGRLALWTTMAATVIGAVVLLPIPFEGWSRLTIQVLQALALTLSFIATVWVSWRQSVSQWLRARATAEGLRGEVFRAILSDGAAKGLLAPALACFVDAHLDWQLAYYTTAGRRYRRSAGNAAPYKVIGYLLLAIAVLLGLAGFATVIASSSGHGR